MTFLGLLIRLLLRAFGVIAHESERPVGPPASVTYPRPEQTGIDHVGWLDHGHAQTGARDHADDEIGAQW